MTLAEIDSDFFATAGQVIVVLLLVESFRIRSAKRAGSNWGRVLSVLVILLEIVGLLFCMLALADSRFATRGAMTAAFLAIGLSLGGFVGALLDPLIIDRPATRSEKFVNGAVEVAYFVPAILFTLLPLLLIPA